MKRTTIFLDEKLLKQAHKYARGQGQSFAWVVREALATYLQEPRKAPTLPRIAGRFASGHSNTSERVDELLWSEPHS